MSLAAITINKGVLAQLRSTLKHQCVSHAYLFIGEARSRLRLGTEFAKAILCCQSPDDACDRCVVCRKIDHGNHEDFYLVQKDENSVKVSAVEGIISSLFYKPIGARTVVLVDDADTMTIQAQNKLLKTLEEPSGSAVIILLAERKDALTDTILSRCITYHLQEGEAQEDSELTALAEKYIGLCALGSSFYKKKDLLEPLLPDKDRCLEFLDVLENKLRDLLIYNSSANPLLLSAEAVEFPRAAKPLSVHWMQGAITAAEDCRKGLKQSYNTGYMLKQMSLRMGSEV
jgi:DNA polymerase III subunit delta'